jgi:hydrogenase maturation protease
VVDELQKRSLPANVLLADFGTSAFRTALEIGEYDKVVFVDAIRLGERPGHVHRGVMGRDDLARSSPLTSFAFSLHESDLDGILATAASINGLPEEVVVVGCEPGDVSLGLGLSNEVEGAIAEIVNLVLEEIGRGRAPALCE